MTRNLGNTDRLIRIVAGAGLIFGGFVKTGGLGCILSIVGLVLVLTGMAGRCPLCSIFNINTCTYRPQAKT